MPPVEASTALGRNPSIVMRPIHGTFFLIDISDNYAGDQCALYEINEVGAFLWERLDGRRTLDELVTLLEEAIVDDVPRHVLEEDVREYLGCLTDNQFVREES